jgi:hypothetical protein
MCVSHVESRLRTHVSRNLFPNNNNNNNNNNDDDSPASTPRTKLVGNVSSKATSAKNGPKFKEDTSCWMTRNWTKRNNQATDGSNSLFMMHGLQSSKFGSPDMKIFTAATATKQNARDSNSQAQESPPCAPSRICF